MQNTIQGNGVWGADQQTQVLQISRFIEVGYPNLDRLARCFEIARAVQDCQAGERTGSRDSDQLLDQPLCLYSTEFRTRSRTRSGTPVQRAWTA